MASLSLAQQVKDATPVIPDFPKPGVQFLDIYSLLENPELHQRVTRSVAQSLATRNFDAVVALESRGYFLGFAIQQMYDVPIILMRNKPGKLPGEVKGTVSTNEYSSATPLEVQVNRVRGKRVVVCDDVLATGGTLLAAAQLVRECGGEVECFAVLLATTDSTTQAQRAPLLPRLGAPVFALRPSVSALRE